MHLLTRKENSRGGPRSCPRLCLCYHLSSTSWFGNINPIPFRSTGPRAALQRISAISQDRLTHVQLLFTWNLSPLQSSKFSFEYLLLPPRSALKAVSLWLAPRAAQQPSRPPTHRRRTLAPVVEDKRPASAPSIFRASSFGR